MNKNKNQNRSGKGLGRSLLNVSKPYVAVSGNGEVENSHGIGKSVRSTVPGVRRVKPGGCESGFASPTEGKLRGREKATK